MGEALSKAFIDPEGLLGCKESAHGVVTCPFDPSDPDWAWGMVQVLFLMAGYGYVLFMASNMLADGSELLLLVPSLAGVVGSIVLPILGAVPDGAIMLFSGLGPKEEAQEKLSVGIGTLAGSTIMLLTVPWGGSIFKGAVPVGTDGVAQYRRREEKAGGLSRGVTPNDSIRSNALVMVATALIYLIIQGPAFEYSSDKDTPNDTVAGREHWYALAGLIACSVAFVCYLFLMVIQSQSETKEYLINAAALRAIESEGPVTLAGIIAPIVSDGISRTTAAMSSGSSYLEGALLDNEGKKKLGKLLKPFFKKYDVNGDGYISSHELTALLHDVGERGITHSEAAKWMERLDPNHSGAIETGELADAMLIYIGEKVREQSMREESPDPRHHAAAVFPAAAAESGAGGEAAAEEADEEEEEMPEDLRQLSPRQQQFMIKKRACLLMGTGTALVLIFSDPMVDVMSNLGSRLGVSNFYVAFVLAPLASNASELLASLAYAGKKSKKTITVALSSLEGAACMNNTFCLGIFMGLVFYQDLAWKFTAETLAILVVELLVACIAVQRTMRLWHAIFALSLFPLSICFVAGLEALGLD